MKRVRKREKPMLWLPFLYGQVSHQTQQCHYSVNNKPPPYPPPSYPQRPSLNQPQSLSTALPMTKTTFSTNKKKHQQKGILQQKACRVHPKFRCHMLNLIPYLLDNSMVAITLAKVHQPPFIREYDSNATCACHGEAPGRSIEHGRALKRKVQGLIDTGWLKFEENRLLNPNIDKQHHTWGNSGSCCYDSSGFSSLCHKPQLQC